MPEKPILLDSYIAKIVSRCCDYPDPESESWRPDVMQGLVVEPRPEGGGVFVIATNGQILCCGSDPMGFTPHKESVFVDRPEFPEGYGFEPPEIGKIVTVKTTRFFDEGRQGKSIRTNWRETMAANTPFVPTEYPMIDPRFLGCVFPVRLRRIRTQGPLNSVNLFSECGRFQWVIMPIRGGDRVGFCGDQIEVRNWSQAEDPDFYNQEAK